ncbi:MAG: DUF3450 domain-containing protein [Halieaceae bacterium]|jgi:hypothetical protein|nr:DUF3450 domain-containing protein [Halieaceae bacterium]
MNRSIPHLARRRRPRRGTGTALAPLFAGALLLAAQSGSAVAQESTQLRALEQEGVERNEERRDKQRAVDAVNAATRELVDAYREELRIVDGLETYVEMLATQLRNQQEEIATLETSITDVAVIERQILPLLARMIDGLEQFVALDLPFLRDERDARVVRLRELLTRSDVTVAEKARRVFEAYQIESDYGRTIEAYRAKLSVDGGSFDADFVRVGRVALMYRTVGDERLGFWNGERWDALPDSPYRRFLEQALKVARQEVAPELLTIPLAASRVETSR